MTKSTRCVSILPEWAYRSCATVNLNDELRARGIQESPDHASGSRSPFLEAQAADRFVAELHRRKGVDWSLGGYLENRSSLLAGSYLTTTGSFIHLGIDMNVPAGSLVASTVCGTVCVVDDDHDHEQGWGPRVILRPEEARWRDVVMILGHLEDIAVVPETRVEPGTPLARVGRAPQNGGWYEHLHVQLMQRARFEEILTQGGAFIDGYGHPRELEALRTLYPDPTPLLTRKS